MVAAAYLARGQIIYKCYVDLVKTYDVVNRELLWKLLGRLGFPAKLMRLIKGLHEGARGKVRIEKCTLTGLILRWGCDKVHFFLLHFLIYIPGR